VQSAATRIQRWRARTRQDPHLARGAHGDDRGLAAGQAIRQAGTRAANVARGPRGAEAALERRHIEAAEQIVAALGTMKGAAMKLGQVMSFLDVGLVPRSTARSSSASSPSCATPRRRSPSSRCAR
jgi:hypothetical protein